MLRIDLQSDYSVAQVRVDTESTRVKSRPAAGGANEAQLQPCMQFRASATSSSQPYINRSIPDNGLLYYTVVSLQRQSYRNTACGSQNVQPCADFALSLYMKRNGAMKESCSKPSLDTTRLSSVLTVARQVDCPRLTRCSKNHWSTS